MDQHTMGAKLLAGSALVFSTMSVHALPIQIQSTYPVLSDGTFHFLDNISANSFNFPQGLKQTFGAMNVTPNGLGGTTGAFTAIPLANVTPQTFLNGPALNTLNFNKFTVAPNFFGRTVDASAQNGPWTLGFLNTSGGSTIRKMSVFRVTGIRRHLVGLCQRMPKKSMRYAFRYGIAGIWWGLVSQARAVVVLATWCMCRKKSQRVRHL